MLRFDQPYTLRPVRLLELWEWQGWRVKVYGISAQGEHPSEVLVQAAKRGAQQRLPQPAFSVKHYGVAYMIIYDGSGCKFWNSMSGICTIMWAGSDAPFTSRKGLHRLGKGFQELEVKRAEAKIVHRIVQIPLMESILHTFGESGPASTQSSSARPSRPLKRGNRTVKTEVLKRGKYLWKDGGEVDRGEITLGSARRVGSSRW